jgi:hypothetical protein
MTSSGKEVKFLAVARKSDKSILASHIASADRSYDYVANVTKVLNSPGWASVTTDKLSLDDPPNVFYVSIDEGGRVFIVITSKGYPSRYIYGSADGNTRGILAELKKQFVERFGDASLTCPAGGLNSKASGILKGLTTEFNDIQNMDKLANVQAKVEGVKSVMASSINQALKNTEKLEDIDDKAVVLADSANKFKSSTGSLKRNMQWRYIRMIILMTLLVGAVLAIIIVPLVLTNKK